MQLSLIVWRTASKASMICASCLHLSSGIASASLLPFALIGEDWYQSETSHDSEANSPGEGIQPPPQGFKDAG